MAVRRAGIPIAKRSGVSTADLSNTPPATAEKTKELLDVIADPTRATFLIRTALAATPKLDAPWSYESYEYFRNRSGCLAKRPMGRAQFRLGSHG